MKVSLARLIASLCLTAGLTVGGMGAATATTSLPLTLQKGVTSTAVGNLQALLATSKRGVFFRYPTYDMSFGPATAGALKHWQRVTHHPATGSIVMGGKEWNQLLAETTLPATPVGTTIVAVAAAVNFGWSIDANQNPGAVRVLHYDAAAKKLTVAHYAPASYAGWAFNEYGQLQLYHTPDGIFSVTRTWPGHQLVSTIYHNAPMDDATCFVGQGNICIHTDAVGNYILKSSHSCVHVASADAQIIEQRAVGTPVIVHGSNSSLVHRSYE
jgi:hypothetical protein